MCDFLEYGEPPEEWLRLESTLQPPPQYDSVNEEKQAVNHMREEMTRLSMAPLSSKVSTQDHSIPTRDGGSIEVRSYRPLSRQDSERLPIYIHFHGGGFLFGNLNADEFICARVAINTEVLVLNVNYRHTPEYIYPTAWNDAEDAFDWIANQDRSLNYDREQIVLGGISAGAQLVAALTQTLHVRMQQSRAVRGQVLMIPCLVNLDCYDSHLEKMKDKTVSSYQQNKDAPILSVSRIRQFISLLQIGKSNPKDLRLNPGNIPPEDVSSLPPTVLGIAGRDPLRDEGLLYGKLLTENGVPTKTTVFKGLPHGFRLLGDKLSASEKWDESIEQGIQWALSNPAASQHFDIEVV